MRGSTISRLLGRNKVVKTNNPIVLTIVSIAEWWLPFRLRLGFLIQFVGRRLVEFLRRS